MGEGSGGKGGKWGKGKGREVGVKGEGSGGKGGGKWGMPTPLSTPSNEVTQPVRSTKSGNKSTDSIGRRDWWVKCLKCSLNGDLRLFNH